MSKFNNKYLFLVFAGAPLWFGLNMYAISAIGELLSESEDFAVLFGLISILVLVSLNFALFNFILSNIKTKNKQK